MNSQTAPDSQVNLLGLDFGSTTSSAVVARANVASHCITGRMQFGDPRIVYRSESVFTPFHENQIELIQIEQHLDRWLKESGIQAQDVFAGASIITGLAAQQANANALARMVENRIGETLMATAGDPSLESWLAFMGSCATLSRHHRETPMINLDIGGGTTNPAVGLDGNVLGTGSYFIGARHFQFVPGTYQLTETSTFGERLLHQLGLAVSIGDRLSRPELDTILGYYVDALEAIVIGDSTFFKTQEGALVEQVPIRLDSRVTSRAVTFSGGVGELIYMYNSGQSLPGTTHFGDLGIDLALRIAASPVLSSNLDTFMPENHGRATVYGLTLHGTEISGATLFLPIQSTLPLRDLPVVSRVKISADVDELCRAISLAKKSPRGACVQVLPDKQGSPTSEILRTLGQGLAQALILEEFPEPQPIVILTPNNLGHALGNYATNWRQRSVNLIVIDEVPTRDAQFVNIGKPHNNIVPISFYGMH